MASHIPEFGFVVSGADYILRPGGYAVILNAAGDVAVGSTPKGFLLPGGGQEVGESPEEAAIRETREECGLHVRILDHVCVADQLVFAADERVHYRKRCAFFLAEVTAETNAGEPDHQLVWLAPQAARSKMHHESQRWALGEAFHQLTEVELCSQERPGTNGSRSTRKVISTRSTASATPSASR